MPCRMPFRTRCRIRDLIRDRNCIIPSGAAKIAIVVLVVVVGRKLPFL